MQVEKIWSRNMTYYKRLQNELVRLVDKLGYTTTSDFRSGYSSCLSDLSTSELSGLLEVECSKRKKSICQI